MLFGIWFLPPVVLGHIGVHVVAARVQPRVSPLLVRKCLVSDAVFVAAMLLQVDCNDSYLWMTITKLYALLCAESPRAAELPGARYGGADWWLAFSAVMLVMVIGFWWPVLRACRQARADESSPACAGCGYPLQSFQLACPECGRVVAECVERVKA